MADGPRVGVDLIVVSSLANKQTDRQTHTHCLPTSHAVGISWTAEYGVFPHIPPSCCYMIHIFSNMSLGSFYCWFHLSDWNMNCFIEYILYFWLNA